MQPATDPRFHRGSDRILGGVCSGLAAGFHVDPLWVRSAFVLLAFAQGISIVLYVVLWLVMPEVADGQAARRSGFDSMTADLHRIWAEVRAQFGTTTPVPGGAPTSPPTPAEAATGGPMPPGAPVPSHNQSLLLGGVLVAIGVIVLANNVGFVDWAVLWPVVLILAGVVLLLRNLGRKT